MAQLPSQSQFGDYGEWPGRDVLDSGGERLGGVREIYLDRETGRPEWVLVDVADGEARFVPLADATVESSQIRVAHTAAAIRSAPGIGAEPRIDQSEERRLYDHYGLGYSETDSDSGLPADEPTREQPAASASATPEQPEATSTPPWRSERSGDEPSEGDSTEAASSWSAAGEESSNLAPPPAEPPSAEEIEAAEIPEPPAASERAFEDFTATTTPEPAPALAAPEPTPELEAPDPTPALEAPTDAIVAPTSAGEILATPEAEDLKAQPGPDVVRPSEAPRVDAAPPAPEPEPGPSGPLEVIAARKTGIAAGAAIAAALFFVIRRLR